MSNFNEIKEKVMTTIGTVADMTKDFAAQTGEKAKSVARIAKLSVEISGEKDSIKKAYTEIGKVYYEAHSRRNDSEGQLERLCGQISSASSAIADKEAEIAAIKAEMNEKGEGPIEVEFEETVSEDSAEECDCGCEEHSGEQHEHHDHEHHEHNEHHEHHHD